MEQSEASNALPTQAELSYFRKELDLGLHSEVNIKFEPVEIKEEPEWSVDDGGGKQQMKTVTPKNGKAGEHRTPTDKGKQAGAKTKQASADETEQAVSKKLDRIERDKHYNNIRQILACTNATVIRVKNEGGYVCCYCPERFPDPADLKEHNILHHMGEDIKKSSICARQEFDKLCVKLDITGLQCNLCNEDIDNLELLIDHLKLIHKLTIYTDVNNIIIPFKFTPGAEQLTCCMCFIIFNNFRSLLEHMNTHYRNFICDICDAGYITKFMAVTHADRIHSTGTFKCSYCPKVCDTLNKIGIHERTKHTHRESMYRCRICDETFRHFHQKQKHLKQVHNVGAEVKCQACDKIFETPTKHRLHVKRHHLLEKNYKCVVCDKEFFSSTHLKDHAVKHTAGFRDHECDMCHKAYTRRKALVAHMKTVHAHKVVDIYDSD